MYRKKDDEYPNGRCLECGGAVYGRTDKKFCSSACRNRYNYNAIRASNLFRGRVIRSLNSNYRILSSLISKGITSIKIPEIVNLGFKPDVFTYSARTREGHEEKRCFDIRYRQTSKQISKISKIPTDY